MLRPLPSSEPPLAVEAPDPEAEPRDEEEGEEAPGEPEPASAVVPPVAPLPPELDQRLEGRILSSAKRPSMLMPPKATAPPLELRPEGDPCCGMKWIFFRWKSNLPNESLGRDAQLPRLISGALMLPALPAEPDEPDALEPPIELEPEPLPLALALDPELRPPVELEPPPTDGREKSIMLGG